MGGGGFHPRKPMTSSVVEKQTDTYNSLRDKVSENEFEWTFDEAAFDLGVELSKDFLDSI